ncbi:folate-binding protein YgfZ [uncultured Corynebacterium sp.]|uniref:CAF17-like 4Fe-4S cluster assembly/insertion protein YgfZ n=1 Tax=uncultured Corynebacterium sp. TaxID=159447 RepID=UPI0025F3AFF4|nr:folate-binding protein [uncultured Corynebacterium sp.]
MASVAFDDLSPIVQHASGAVAVPEGDPGGRSGVAWHYGAPLVEQRALSESAALVDRSMRRVLRISGPDRLEWLNTLFSQKLDDAQPGRATEALDLDPQGRILHHMGVAVLADAVLLDVSATGAESLQKFLTMMIFRSDVTVEEADLAILSLVGPAAGDVLAAAGLSDPGALAVAEFDDGPAAVVRGATWPAAGSRDLFVERGRLTEAWDALVDAGAKPAGLMAWEAERVTSLHPEPGLDVDEKMIPHEAPEWIDDAVHLEKGCYRGQETVSRVHNLGRPPRTMVLLHLDGSDSTTPEPGDPVVAGKRTVGRVGTVVDHHEYGPIALALVKRSSQEGVDLTAGGVAASVDPATVDRDDQVRPGRAAVDRLRGR